MKTYGLYCPACYQWRRQYTLSSTGLRRCQYCKTPLQDKPVTTLVPSPAPSPLPARLVT